MINGGKVERTHELLNQSFMCPPQTDALTLECMRWQAQSEVISICSSIYHLPMQKILTLECMRWRMRRGVPKVRASISSVATPYTRPACVDEQMGMK